MTLELLNAALGPLVTLFVIVDPIGLAPVFVALTAGAAGAERRRIALRAVAVAAGILAVFGLIGEALLETVGIGLPAFRISGGLMLFLIALEMLFERRPERRSRTAEQAMAEPETADAAPAPLSDARPVSRPVSPPGSADRPIAATEAEKIEPGGIEAGGIDRDPSVFPLATPLLAGPGAMASMILLTARAESPAEEALVYLSLALVLGVCLALFLAAGLIERLLGPVGIRLTTRLLGVLLGALAVQFVLDGLADYGFTVVRAA